MRENKTYIPLSLLIFAILTILLVNYACQQQKGKTFVIGYVNPRIQEEEGAQGFLRNMPKFGFVEGKNVTYIKFESRDTSGMETALRDMTAKRVDLIFAMTSTAAGMAKKVTEGTNIPVVMICYDPVRSEIVKSLTEPGGNITGVRTSGSTQKSLEFLRAIAPEAKHILVPVKFDIPGTLLGLEDLKQEAAKFSLNISIAEVGSVEDLRASMSSMPRDIDAIFILHSVFIGSNIDIVLDNAIKRKVPVISAGHVDYRKGVVLSYGPTDDRSGLQAARLANSILHNSILPADLPVETPDFFLGINLKTAQSIGLEIPDEILQQADFIVRE